MNIHLARDYVLYSERVEMRVTGQIERHRRQMYANMVKSETETEDESNVFYVYVDEVTEVSAGGAAPQDLTDSPPPLLDGSKRDNPKASDVAIVTYLVKRSMTDMSIFLPFVPLTFRNFVHYTHKHGHPFFYGHENLVPHGLDRGAYWGKMSVLRHYLKTSGFKWILWTDLDVLIMDDSIPMHTFLDSSRIAPEVHIVSVLECGWGDSPIYPSSIRSGFFFVRNSPETLRFLDHWESTYQIYRHNIIPEQRSLETIFSDPMWSWMFYVYPSCQLHTYPECYRPGMFSVHFPGSRKLLIPEWAKHAPLYQGDLDFFLTQPTISA